MTTTSFDCPKLVAWIVLAAIDIAVWAGVVEALR